MELLRQPGDEWRHVRRQAAGRLVGIDEPAAYAALVEALGSRDRAVAAIAARHVAAVPELIRQLADRQAGDAMAGALGRLRAPEARIPLTATLATAGDHILLAVACIVALARIDAAGSVPAFVAAAAHDHRDVRIHALRALHRAGGTEAGRAALTATDDPDPEVRATAVRVLARWGGPDAVGRLCALTDGIHVTAAVTGLLRLADPASLPTLLDVVRRVPDRRTRHLAGRAIARIGRPVHLYGRDPRVRRVAIWLTGLLPGHGALHTLTRALRDPDELVRSRAAAALATLGDPAAAEALREALSDVSPRVRANSVTALHVLGVRASGLENDPHQDVRAAARRR